MQKVALMNCNEISPYIFVSNDKIVEVSPDFLSLTGYSLMDVLGKSLEYLFKLILINKEDDHYIIFTKDSTAIKVLLNHRYNLYTFTPINDFKTQTTFEYIENLHLTNGRGFGIYSVCDLRLIKSNKNYDDFLFKEYGYDKCPLGRSLNEIRQNQQDSSHYSLFETIIESGETLCIDKLELTGYRNEAISLSTSLMPIYENNKLKYIVESFNDITILEENNKKMLSYERQKEFFSFICHEFKTPLTVTLSAIQAIELICKDDLSQNSLNYLKKINLSSLQQWRLVTHLLDILKSDSGYLQVHNKNLDIVNMTKLIIDAVSDYARTKEINLIFTSDLDRKTIGIDDEKYERILLNLLSNAIKYSPKGSSVYVTLTFENGRVKIIVKDTGIGIPEEEQETIFQLFSQLNNSLTRKSEGTGIGLYLVKQLVNAMGGDISVTSFPNKGSSFILLLPAEEVKEEQRDLSSYNMSNNRLIEVTNIEFSNIYLD